MVKRKKIDPEPEEPEDEEPEPEEPEDEEPYVPEVGGLTYTKRYIVGIIKPKQSDEGSKCYGLFFETQKLVEAKKEAEKVFKEDNLEVVVWDRDKWLSDAGTEVARYIPETEVKDDEDGHRNRNSKPTGTPGAGAKAPGSKITRSRRKKATASLQELREQGGGSTASVPRNKKIPPSKRKLKRKR